VSGFTWERILRTFISLFLVLLVVVVFIILFFFAFNNLSFSSLCSPLLLVRLLDILLLSKHHY
jgi:hypothetical protein